MDGLVKNDDEKPDRKRRLPLDVAAARSNGRHARATSVPKRGGPVRLAWRDFMTARFEILDSKA